MHAEAQSAGRLHQIFLDSDADNSGTLSWDEFEKHLGDRRVSAYLASLDLNVSELRVVFDILDTERTGCVTIDDFVWGCMRLRGTAKSVDMCTLLYEYRKSTQAIEASLASLVDKVKKLEDGSILSTKSQQRAESSDHLT